MPLSANRSNPAEVLTSAHSTGRLALAELQTCGLQPRKTATRLALGSMRVGPRRSPTAAGSGQAGTQLAARREALRSRIVM